MYHAYTFIAITYACYLYLEFPDWYQLINWLAILTSLIHDLDH